MVILHSENKKKTSAMRYDETPTRVFDLLDSQELTLRYIHYLTRDAEVRRQDVRRADYRRRSTWISYALLHRNVQRGEGVGVVSSNRTECVCINLGIMQMGATPIQLLPNLTAEQYLLLLKGVRVLILEDGELYRRFRRIMPQMESLKYVVLIDGKEGVDSLHGLVEEGRRFANDEQLSRRKSLITTDDICLYEYRGGTCPAPLSHKRMLSMMLEG